MSKKKNRKKKELTATRPPAAPKVAPVSSGKSKSKRASVSSAPARPLTFGKETLTWIAGGFALVLLGMLLMAGGEMPSPDVWDEDIIYSFRRITLAPMIILGGIGVVIYGLLKK